MIANLWRFISTLYIRTIRTHHCSSLAASISFYAILSFIPFVLLSVSILSHFAASSDQTLQDIIAFITGVLPVSSSETLWMISSTIKGKTIYGLVGIIGLVWASTHVFSVLEYAMHRIWRTAEVRRFWRSRFMALICIPFLFIFLVLSIALTGLLRLVASGRLPVLNTSLLEIPFLGKLITLAIPVIFSVAIFFFIYYLLPETWHHGRSAFYGAILAGVLWEGSKLLFDYYVRNFAHLFTIYGSFTSIALLLLWVYYSALIVLFGAEFGALLHESKVATCAGALTDTG